MDDQDNEQKPQSEKIILSINEKIDDSGWPEFLYLAGEDTPARNASGPCKDLFQVLRINKEILPYAIDCYTTALQNWRILPMNIVENAIKNFRESISYLYEDNATDLSSLPLEVEAFDDLCRRITTQIKLAQLPEKTPLTEIQRKINSIVDKNPKWKEPLQEEILIRKDMIGLSRRQKLYAIFSICVIIPIIFLSISIVQKITTPSDHITHMEQPPEHQTSLNLKEALWCKKEHINIEEAAKTLQQNAKNIEIPSSVDAFYQQSKEDWDNRCRDSYISPDIKKQTDQIKADYDPIRVAQLISQWTQAVR